MERVHVFISGRVQGVWFRQSTAEKARRIGVTGWVRNLYDGRVEAVAEGEKSALMEFLDWCRTGPESARVDSVEIEWEPARGDMDGFSVRY